MKGRESEREREREKEIEVSKKRALNKRSKPQQRMRKATTYAEKRNKY
jgi:hypothetical protein